MKFTDSQLASLYIKISHEYKKLKSEGSTDLEIYKKITNSLSYEFTQAGSNFSNLENQEKAIPFIVVNTFFSALTSESRPNYIFYPQPNVNLIYTYNHKFYSPTNDVLFTWLLLDSLHHHSFHYHHHHHQSDNSHGHSSKKNEQQVYLLLVLLAAITAGTALIATYYILREMLNSAERIMYNEGTLQAVLSISSIVASGFASAILSTLFASSPLAMFALAAGISNPVGFVIFGLVSLTLIGAALGCFITNQVMNFVAKDLNKDSLDPMDPHRFGLSDEESQLLLSKGFDPIKVKCAMTELHMRIGKEMPPLLHRLFSDSNDTQEYLNKIRKLRRGELAAKGLTIGYGTSRLDFDLAYIQPTAPAYVESEIGSGGLLYPEVPNYLDTVSSNYKV